MILGHELQKEYFKKALKKGLAHAYLFYGPAHVGKLTFAKTIAKALFCKNAALAPEKICDLCRDCRRVEENTHPSLTLLDLKHTLLSKKDERKNIPIEDISELKRLFSYAPSRGEWRIAIINEAEKMSLDAANSFLKLLEEPGGYSLFILITSSPDAVISTIASRAIPIRFSRVADATLLKYLEEKIPDISRRESILSFALGYPGNMLRLCEEKGLLEAEAKKLASFQSASKRGIPELFRISANVSGDPELRREFSDFLIRSLRDSLFQNPASATVLKRVLEIAYLLESTNINPRLALDTMALHAHSALIK